MFEGFGLDNLRALLGMGVIIAIAWGVSEKRGPISWKLAGGAIGLQFLLTLIFFGFPPITSILYSLNDGLAALVAATKQGSSFVFGYLGGEAAPFPKANPDMPDAPILAFEVLPLVIVISVLSALLWHWGILSRLTKGLAFLFARALGLGGATSLGVAANVFLGMVEAPLLIRPYFAKLARSELFILMTVGLSTVAGTVMAIYATMLSGVLEGAVAHLLTASLISVPAGVLLAKIMVPEETAITDRQEAPDFRYQSSMDAFTKGVEQGLKLLLSIVAMLLAAVAIVALFNIILKAIFVPLGYEISLEQILGWVFAPFMWLMGISADDMFKAGELMGVKTILNEFLAYIRLAGLPVEGAESISDRTRIIMTYALCGFANIPGLGIMIAGLTGLCPERREDILSLAWPSMLSGTLATMMTGCVVAFLPMGLFV